ncbi:folate/biopterin family MFS transporter [Cyanobacterium sp. uoEpiScrs1]|uniref:folate/biopterin family MFS transporter n=1 Tax=Cyanobacterium sp. uoEpiScrs1 TaxID=2976343 RepID=UPI002269B37C|nr:folate/biopterin family MFS transporter [Cyanobacterium sp. uoEpiScrs1]
MIIALPRFSQIKNTLINALLLGNKSTPELWGILTVYFVQGILSLARLAISFFLKENLGLPPAQMSALTGIAALPWVIKPVFGFISDSLPIFGYRRRPYLILSGVLGSFAWLMLGTIVDNLWSATVSLLLVSVSIAISDVIVDSLVVERARKESLGQVGSLQSLTWGTSALGGVITAYLSGWLLQRLSSQTIFIITAIFPLIVVMVAGLITEKSVNQNCVNKISSRKPSVKQQLQELWKAFKQKSILFPVVFIFIWQATPNAESAFFFFITNELGFGPEFLGLVRLVTSLATLVGIGIYYKFLKTVSFQRILGCGILISSSLGMTMLLLVTHTNRVIGISDRWFSLGDSLVLTVMGEITFMPILVLSTRLCPKGIEATLFALLMSILNLSGLVSHELGALLTKWLGITQTNFDSLWLLVIITNLSTLLPLPFLCWLPATNLRTEEP